MKIRSSIHNQQQRHDRKGHNGHEHTTFVRAAAVSFRHVALFALNNYVLLVNIIHRVSKNCDFCISQGSVATVLR